MRLDQYMRISSPDDDISKFRSFKIEIVKEDVGYIDIINRLAQKYDYIIDTLNLIDNMNKVFKSECRGIHKLKYRLCLDKGIHLSEMNIDVTSRKKIQLKYYEINDKFAKIKGRVEKELANL